MISDCLNANETSSVEDLINLINEVEPDLVDNEVDSYVNTLTQSKEVQSGLKTGRENANIKAHRAETASNANESSEESVSIEELMELIDAEATDAIRNENVDMLKLRNNHASVDKNRVSQQTLPSMTTTISPPSRRNIKGVFGGERINSGRDKVQNKQVFSSGRRRTMSTTITTTSSNVSSK